MPFFEASPKTNQNINEVFYHLVGEIVKVKENKYLISTNNKKIKDVKNKEKNLEKKEIKKKSFEKEIDLNKNNISLKLYKFLNY